MNALRPLGPRPPLALLALLSLPLLAQDKLPELVVDKDDVLVTRSCRLRIAKPLIPDANNDGVIHIKAPNITVELDPTAPLAGAPASQAPDTLTGIGVRIENQSGVTLKGFRIRGFKVGIHATRADGLTIEGADTSDVFRQRLRSTPAAEDGADWLWPHDNDQRQWMNNYGAAISIEDSSKVTVRDSVCRRSQNGLLLSRVLDSRIYDNDFSFLSGWGLGLWRSSGNVISRNAFDFCVRGYSHGIYNRGQDSAGILMFEQCSKNVIAENSITHGGDCIFGFAGKEALGETPAPSKDFDYKRRGCNDNIFIRNDLSYAPAHGLEMTFSFGNTIAHNRMVGNAICGIWGGYSQQTAIAFNDFTDNGGMGYGLERGGVNIEHGYQNAVVSNRFTKNRCGVHLWWSDNKDFAKKPWGAANYRGCADNVIEGNVFEGDTLAIHLRSATSTIVTGNTMNGVTKELEADSDVKEAAYTAPDLPSPQPLGHRAPVGARANLRGRENIVMTEWGPWDHESPLVQPRNTASRTHSFALHNFTRPKFEKLEGDVTVQINKTTSLWELSISSNNPGITRYRVLLTDTPADIPVSYPLTGILISTDWTLRIFPTTAKPHENPAAWETDWKNAKPLRAKRDNIAFPFGGGAPNSVPFLAKGAEAALAKIPANNFGLVAETSLPLPKGKWRITTLSDDGVRVTADGKKIIDNWTWHVPTKDTAVLDLAEPRTVTLFVEYFELDGNAVLTLEIEPVSESH